MMIDWVEISKSVPDLAIAAFIVFVIFAVLKDNRAAILLESDKNREEARISRDNNKEIMNNWREHLIELQAENHDALAKQEELFARTILEISNRHEIEVEKIMVQGRASTDTISRNIRELTRAIDKNTESTNRVLIALGRKTEKEKTIIEE